MQFACNPVSDGTLKTRPSVCAFATAVGFARQCREAHRPDRNHVQNVGGVVVEVATADVAAEGNFPYSLLTRLG